MPDQPGSGAVSEQDHYEVLGAQRDSDAAELARAYRRAMRRTHPDMGGSAEAFAAVQVAWETLGDPDRRARFDAGGDDWAFDDWGVAAAEPAPDTGADASEDAGKAHSRPRATRDDARTPFAPGAVELPELSLPAVRRPRQVPFAALDGGGMLAQLSSGGAALVVLSFGAARIDEVSYGLALMSACLTALMWPVARRFGWTGVLTWAVPLLGIVGLAVVGGMSVDPGPGAVFLGAVGLVAVATVFRLAVRAERDARPHAQSREAERAGRRFELHELAEDWNLVRHALTTPRAVLERVLEVAAPIGARRYVMLDPHTARTTVRVLDADVPDGTWFVLDPDGRVLALAAAGAPEAWSRVIRRGTRR